MAMMRDEAAGEVIKNPYDQRCKMYRCQYRGSPCVLKQFTFQSPLEAIDVQNEVEVQRSLEGLAICSVIDYDSDGRTWATIHLESMNCDLLQEIERRRTSQSHWSDEELMGHFYRLINTFAEAQKRGVCHRDIKPQNIFLKDGQLYVSGFGCAKQMKAETTSTVKGSPYFLSPELKEAYFELVSGKPAVTTYNPFRSDVYSLGLTFLFMCLLRQSNELLQLDALKRATQMIVSDLQRAEAIKQLLMEMLSVDFCSRPDFMRLAEILQIEALPPTQYQDTALSNSAPETYEGAYSDSPYTYTDSLASTVTQDYIDAEVLPRLNSGDLSQVEYALQSALEVGLSFTCLCWRPCQCCVCSTQYSLSFPNSYSENLLWLCSEACQAQYYSFTSQSLSAPTPQISNCSVCGQCFIPTASSQDSICSLTCKQQIAPQTAHTPQALLRPPRQTQGTRPIEQRPFVQPVEEEKKRATRPKTALKRKPNHIPTQPSVKLGNDKLEALPKDFSAKCFMCFEVKVIKRRCQGSTMMGKGFVIHIYCELCAIELKGKCRNCSYKSSDKIPCFTCHKLSTEVTRCTGIVIKDEYVVHTYCLKCVKPTCGECKPLPNKKPRP